MPLVKPTRVETADGDRKEYKDTKNIGPKAELKRKYFRAVALPPVIFMS